MKAKQAVRDVGGALSVSYAKTDQIAKAIPFELGMTIDKALATSPELAEMYESDVETREVIDMAKAIEGMPRHASTHAAGVVISRRRSMNMCRCICRIRGPATQFTMTTIEELGLLKMDFGASQPDSHSRRTRDDREKIMVSKSISRKWITTIRVCTK